MSNEIDGHIEALGRRERLAYKLAGIRLEVWVLGYRCLKNDRLRLLLKKALRV